MSLELLTNQILLSNQLHVLTRLVKPLHVKGWVFSLSS